MVLLIRRAYSFDVTERPVHSRDLNESSPYGRSDLDREGCARRDVHVLSEFEIL